MSDFQPHLPSPSELGPDPQPETYTVGFTSESRDEREWEEETMSIGQSVNGEEYNPAWPHSRPSPERQVVYENAPYPPYPVIPQEQELLQETLQETKPKGGKTFVGGFIAGLRKIPKAVVKSHFYDRKATRKGAPGTELETGPSHFLPSYEEPGTSIQHPESVQYVQGMDMPIASKPPTEVPYADPVGQSSQQRLSQQPSPRRSGASAPPILSVPNSPRFQPPEAVAVEPLPASDYAKMDSPIRFAPPDDSFSVHVTRVRKFFRELKDLPWTSERVAVDYVPAKSSRAHTGKAKPKGSWYSINKLQDIDLLAPAPAPGSGRTATLRLRSEDGGTTGSVRSTARVQQPDGRTPLSYMTSPALFPSPGASSHGQGQHVMSYSYYFTPPQPLYVYQSPMTAPLHGTDSSSSSMSPPEVHQAVPVFMMAGPPPGLLPSPPPAVHAAQHHQATRATSPPSHVPSARPLSHARQSRHSGSNSH